MLNLKKSLNGLKDAVKVWKHLLLESFWQLWSEELLLKCMGKNPIELDAVPCTL